MARCGCQRGCAGFGYGAQLHLVVDGARFHPAAIDGGVYLFASPQLLPARGGRLLDGRRLPAGRRGSTAASTGPSRSPSRPDDTACATRSPLHRPWQPDRGFPLCGMSRIRDPAVFPHLAPQAARGHRNDNAFLVNIESNVGDTIRHDTSSMHEARRRSIRCNPRCPAYCETGRPVLRRTCRLELA